MRKGVTAEPKAKLSRRLQKAAEQAALADPRGNH
jgi:hypothetical protein